MSDLQSKEGRYAEAQVLIERAQDLLEQVRVLHETALLDGRLPDEPTTDALTFADFRRANVARCIKWHPQGIGSWSPSDWLTALTGELGELASLLKMRNRERDGLVGNKFSPSDKQVADELADVLTYLDLLAEVLGVDLAKAAVEKFNEVSQRVGFPDRLPLLPDGADARDARRYRWLRDQDRRNGEACITFSIEHGWQQTGDLDREVDGRMQWHDDVVSFVEGDASTESRS